MLLKITADRVKELAGQLGFALCGVARIEPVEHADHVRQWLASGKAGGMLWMHDELEKRLDPRRLMSGAESVICVADYVGNSELGTQNAQRENPAVPRSEFSFPSSGKIARYAQFNDYHAIIKKRLHTLSDTLRAMAPDHQFRSYVDTAPVLERHWAARAGLGWIGKNTLLIHPRHGSHLMLGQIVTTLKLRADSPEPDHCGQCARCIDACPTRCITPHSIDASRCISYLTIEHRGAIPADLQQPMADWLFGCDACQQACPYNEPGRTDALIFDRYGSRPDSLPLLTVLNWTEADRQEAFTRSSMKRAKLDQMKRNALIVAGHHLRLHADAELESRLRQISGDGLESPIIRDTAKEVLERLDTVR